MNGTGAAIRHGFAVCVGGISGVGKTTLLQHHVAGEPRDQQVTGSSVIRQIIAPDGFEALDRWPSARREQVREESIARLVAMRAACPGRLLIDGHFTLRNRGTGALESVFTPGDRGFYQALVLVDAAAVQVMAQRTRDETRRRNETDADVEAHLEFERAWAHRLHEEMGVPLLVIADAELERRLTALRAFLGRVTGGAGDRVDRSDP